MSLLAKRLHLKSEYDCVTFGVGELLSQLFLLAGLNCCCQGFRVGGCIIVLHPYTQVKDWSATQTKSIKKVTCRDSPCLMKIDLLVVNKGYLPSSLLLLYQTCFLTSGEQTFCSTTVLHCNVVLSQILPLSKNCSFFKLAVFNCSALL